MQPGWTSLIFDVNGESRAAVFPTHHTLLEVLREELALPGTKHGCELGECGTCAVLVDGRPILSCLALAADMTGKKIETVEGLQIGNALHPLQQTMADLGAAQCGYCTPGILMTAKALLAENPSPTDGEIRAALAGNLCRCTGYHKIVEAIEGAAALMRGEDWVAPREVLYGAVEPAAGGYPPPRSSPTRGEEERHHPAAGPHALESVAPSGEYPPPRSSPARGEEEKHHPATGPHALKSVAPPGEFPPPRSSPARGEEEKEAHHGLRPARPLKVVPPPLEGGGQEGG